MRILLVQPQGPTSLVGFNRLARPEPLALEILAGSLRDHDVRVLDLRVDTRPAALQEDLASFQPQIVGVTAYTIDVPSAKAIIQEVKATEPGIFTVVGGHHASLQPGDFDGPDTDFVVVGEGEVTFTELVRALETGVDYRQVQGLIFRERGRQVFVGPRTPLANLDQSPLPDREVTDRYRDSYWLRFWQGVYTMESARGCPYRCNFCSVWKFYGGRCRLKSAEAVVQQIAALPGDFAGFVDDNFLQNLPRAAAIHERLKAVGVKKRYWMQARSDSILKRPDIVEKWASIGLTTVLVGLEAFRDSDLAKVNKHNSIRANEEAVRVLHANNVDIWGAFLIDPQWLRADFDALIQYVRGLKITFPQFTVLTPLPGTDLFRERVQDLVTRNFARFDFMHTVLPTRMPLEEFYENMARLYASTTLGLADIRQKVRLGNIPIQQLQSLRGVMRELTNPLSYLAEGSE
ncbi:MAG: B12-binding domain-containing radical SAM protein [Chloroflexota bacterium]